ncbi:MAG: hypothetical protein HRT87_01720 [Legionellales bacterium]|nr:hypothetical protein [Legionellales bacterium]
MSVFFENIIKTYGEKGEHWLKQLPLIIQRCANKWNFSITKICTELSYSYIVFVNVESDEAVVKVIFDEEQFSNELAILQIMQGKHCIKLLGYLKEYKALLLAKADFSLSDYFPEREKESIAIYSMFIQKYMHSKIVFDLPKKYSHMHHWFKSIKYNDEIDNALITKALYLINSLDKEELSLIHGDLHHGNVMNYQGDWVMIDPKGIVGSISFEISAFIINPHSLITLDFINIIENRIHELSKILSIESSVLLEWTFVRAVLAACWCVEDNMNPLNFIKIAKDLKKSIS